ncbi:MAG TPA: hypothetical protein GX717_04330, partial [Clostridiaceae bacterium]|nr:hypothetical protein [Clostridiaceae bacterium]
MDHKELDHSVLVAVTEHLKKKDQSLPVNIQWESGMPLTPEEEKNIVAKIKEIHPVVEIGFVTNPLLLAGYVVVVDDVRLDFSLESTLNRLSDDLMHRRDLQAWQNYSTPLIAEYGTVLNVADGIVQVDGLPNCMNDELIDFGQKKFGIAM